MSHDRELKKRTLLEAALVCISEKGYEGTRLTDVSDTAQVSVGVIQHYFGTREHLLNEALTYASDTLAEDFSSLSSSGLSPWDQLRGMIRVVCSMPDLYHRGSLWLEMSSLSKREPQLRGRLQNVYTVWSTSIRDAVVRGKNDGSLQGIDQENIEDLVAIFLAFFDGYEYEIASSLVANNPAELERRATFLARRLFRPIDSHPA